MSLNLDPSGPRATDEEKDKRIELALRGATAFSLCSTTTHQALTTSPFPFGSHPACQRLHYYLPTLAETLNPDGLAAWKFCDASARKDDEDEHKLEKRFGIVSYMEAKRNSMGITNQVGLLEAAPHAQRLT